MVDQVIDILREEIASIGSPKIKEFVVKALSAAPAYFWTAPASTTGKYHPVFSLGKGGLVRHTKAVVKFAREFIVAMELEKYSDHIIAASILHDIIKNGEFYVDGRFDPREKEVTKNHGLSASIWLSKHVNVEDPEIKFVTDLIAKHMGRWSPEGCKPQTLAEWCVHLADFTASRRFLDIKDWS